MMGTTMPRTPIPCGSGWTAPEWGVHGGTSGQNDLNRQRKRKSRPGRVGSSSFAGVAERQGT